MDRKIDKCRKVVKRWEMVGNLGTMGTDETYSELVEPMPCEACET